MYPGASTSLLIFKGIMLCVMTFLSIVANSLTLVILYKCHEINPVAKVFLTSMTVADLLAVFMYLPTISAVAVDRWPFGTTLCSITGFVNVGAVFRAILSLLGVTFECFLAVTRPYQYPTLMTVKRACAIILGIWLLTFTAAVSGISFEYNPYWHICLRPSKINNIQIILLLTLGCVPLLLISVMCFHLFLLARFHAAKIAAQERAIGKKIRQESIYYILHNDCLPFCTVCPFLNCIS